MKVFIVHNFYQIAGGEDAVFKNEMTLLKNNGHDVIIYTVDNAAITTVFAKLCLLFNITFSYSQYSKVSEILKTELPDIVHVHNYFPLISPSVFYACKNLNIRVVHTLHNYRAVCPTSLLMYEGKINEQSISGNCWWTVTKKVYRNSFIGSLALACMVELHKRLGTWQSKVDRFVALTEFSKHKYVEAGWPADKIVVKPNFIPDPIANTITEKKRGGYALYLGRLSEEKGIDTLLDAWTRVELSLKVIGDGPLKSSVESNALASVEYIGLKKKDEVLALIKNADFIIMPSTWYETFGMVIIEAFACGIPVLASRLGSLQTIIVDGVTGVHFEAGNPVDLAEKAQWMIDNSSEVKKMGGIARKEYLAKYTPEKNYALLMDIYQQAIMECKNDGPRI